MKITVITGSPRRKGNSFAMTEAFIRAAEQRGHTIERFDAAFLKIGGCHACMTCYKTGKACSFDDDFNRIAPAILESEAVVFTMPVYWYSIPAQIKGVIDRLFSLVVGGKAYAGKKCALIACCEEEDMTVLDGVRVPMERTAALLKWEMVGQVLIPGVLNEGDIDRTEGCRSGRALLSHTPQPLRYRCRGGKGVAFRPRATDAAEVAALRPRTTEAAEGVALQPHRDNPGLVNEPGIFLPPAQAAEGPSGRSSARPGGPETGG